ncbi:MAG: amidohydrolase [Planktomarina sp.]|nr:amidohydrolase [Planktomarina sp.]|tara:strand:+ start:122 stop:1267 length:1146 start_codon:yes stop_codon:yes gene_type:complete
MVDNTKILTALRHNFHQFPELGFCEDQTKCTIANFLNDLDFEVYEGCGVVGVLRNGTSSRSIGLRADMDALPITERSVHDYVSQREGVMHACGHDGHMAMLLGAAQKLTKSPNFDGTVVFIFQPNEEHGLGAKAMIDEGFLEKHPIDEVYGIHNLPGAPIGQISTRTGLICSSESLFEIKIKGQGGHASMPHLGQDTITVGAEIIQALQTVVSRKLTPGCGAVLSVTEFFTDGQRNVLPGHASLKGDVRARSKQDRDQIEGFMQQICKGIEISHNVTTKFTFDTQFIETINSAEPVNAVVRVSDALGLETISNREPMSFSEDFAHFSNAIPGCFLLLGNGSKGKNARPLHSSDYDFNDDLLPIGSDFWTALVADRLPLVKG